MKMIDDSMYMQISLYVLMFINFNSAQIPPV